jgi:hypothetical protein
MNNTLRRVLIPKETRCNALSMAVESSDSIVKAGFLKFQSYVLL